MGGLFVIIMLPMLLPLAILYFLQVALPLIMTILLVWNIAVTVVLILVRWLWKRSGTMDRTYLSTLPNWKRILLTIVKHGLLVFIFWEAGLVFLCWMYVFWRPELLTGML